VLPPCGGGEVGDGVCGGAHGCVSAIVKTREEKNRCTASAHGPDPIRSALELIALNIPLAVECRSRLGGGSQ